MLEGFAVQPLAAHHDREQFSCGQDELDRFIRQLARKQNANDSTRVHVYANDSGEIAGYYTLSALTLELDGLPPALQRGRSQYLPVPATLLGRLAIDRRYSGKRLGTLLLSNAMRTAFEASRTVASAFLVIDAKPSALDWYLRQPIEFDRMPGDALRLLIPMSAIGRELAR